MKDVNNKTVDKEHEKFIHVSLANKYFNHSEFRDLNDVANTKNPLARDVIVDRKIGS